MTHFPYFPSVQFQTSSMEKWKLLVNRKVAANFLKIIMFLQGTP